jgi:putative membrane protein
MTPSDPTLLGRITGALGVGLPHLLLQFVIALGLLAAGVAIYMAVTPFRERQLIAGGNIAAGVVLAGAITGLAVPIAATLATTAFVPDLVIWGGVAVLLQLLVILAVSLVFHHLRATIQRGNVAAALVLAATQIAVGLLNAAVMIPT